MAGRGTQLPGSEILEALLVVWVVCVVVGELDGGSAESPGLVQGQAGGLEAARGGNARLLGASCTRSNAQE